MSERIATRNPQPRFTARASENGPKPRFAELPQVDRFDGDLRLAQDRDRLAEAQVRDDEPLAEREDARGELFTARHLDDAQIGRGDEIDAIRRGDDRVGRDEREHVAQPRHVVRDGQLDDA